MDLAGLVQQVAYPLSSLVDARTLWVQPRDPSRAMSQESVETLARLNEVFNRGDVDGAMDGVIARAHWHGRGKVSGASIDRRQFDLRRLRGGKFVQAILGFETREQAHEAARLAG
jgi:hypothetical protein